MGYLQPKKIFIDDIEIEAPSGMRLYSARIDHEEMQSPYSSLFFQNTYHFPLPELSRGSFWFHAINSNAKANALHLYVSVDNCAKNSDEAEDNARKFILHHKEKKGYTDFKEIKSKECFGFVEKLEKDSDTGFIFHRKKLITISAHSYSSYEIEKILRQFCTDLPKEK
jgi:hypothetical protein